MPRAARSQRGTEQSEQRKVGRECCRPKALSAAGRLRSVPEVLASVQYSGCARGDLSHRARGSDCSGAGVGGGDRQGLFAAAVGRRAAVCGGGTCRCRGKGHESTEGKEGAGGRWLGTRGRRPLRQPPGRRRYRGLTFWLDVTALTVMPAGFCEDR